jgi:hypothetical protein
MVRQSSKIKCFIKILAIFKSANRSIHLLLRNYHSAWIVFKQLR